MLNVQIALPGKNAPRTKRFEAVIDSGASRCLFHSDFAVHMGIDLQKCEIELTHGIGGEENTFVHDVTLYIPGGPVLVKAGFKDKLPVPGLLGMTGFFEPFNVTFNWAAKTCYLECLSRA